MNVKEKKQIISHHSSDENMLLLFIFVTTTPFTACRSMDDVKDEKKSRSRRTSCRELDLLANMENDILMDSRFFFFVMVMRQQRIMKNMRRETKGE